MEPIERIELLERAVADIRYALENIPATPDGETDLNLYNSLAHAYQDLADEEGEGGAPVERVAALRAQAHDATQRAYRTNPDSTFVVETYARSLISDARAMPEKAAENAVEVLNIVYAAMARDKSGQRRFALGKLADNAINLLLELNIPQKAAHEPTNEIEALVLAIRALASGTPRYESMELADFPPANRLRAAELLAHPLLRGNPQAVRLRYALRCLDAPRDFRGQLELLQSLQGGGTVISPQMRLELALLLQQCDRHHEAARLFRELRRLWREGEHYVEVPERLRWLMTLDGQSQRQVTAKVMAGSEQRRAAKVRELQETEVLFRPQEFGQQEFKPGATIRGLISFGHNGPFLRPTTVIKKLRCQLVRGLVEGFAATLGWNICGCNVIVEGISDVALLWQGATLYYDRHQTAILGDFDGVLRWTMLSSRDLTGKSRICFRRDCCWLSNKRTLVQFRMCASAAAASTESSRGTENPDYTNLWQRTRC